MFRARSLTTRETGRWGRRGVTIALIVCLITLLGPAASFAQSAASRSGGGQAARAATIDPALEELGVTSETSYESPTFGYEVEWSEPWELNGDGLAGSPVSSDEVAGIPTDGLHLISAEDGSVIDIYGNQTEGSWLDTGEPVAEQNSAFYDDYPDNENLRQAGITEVQILLNDYDDAYSGTLLLTVWEDERWRITYDEIRVYDDYFVQTVVSLSARDFLDGYLSATESIELDGDLVLQFLDTNEVEDAVDDIVDQMDEDGIDGDAETPAPDDTDADEQGDDTDEQDGDAAGYLAAVREHVDTLRASESRFSEILSQEGSLSESDADEINAALQLWLDAPAIAGDLDAPAGFDDLQATYEAYAGALSDAAAAFIDWIESEEGSSAADAAIEAFQTAISEAEALGSQLDGMLENAGA